jgi:hypothetical protein
MMTLGAARFGRRTVRPHAHPAAPLPLHESQHEAAMTQSTGSNATPDNRFIGFLPDHADVLDYGIPWGWAAECFWSADHGAARVPVDPPARRSWAAASDHCPEYDPFDSHDSEVKARDAWNQNRRHREEIEYYEQTALAKRKSCRLLERLSCGELHAFGRRDSQSAGYEWMPQELWNYTFKYIDQYHLREARLRFNDTGKLWISVYVFGISEGLSLKWAAIVFDTTGDASLITGENDFRVQHIQQQFVRELRAGRFVVFGERNGKREKLTQHAIANGEPDFANNKIDEYENISITTERQSSFLQTSNQANLSVHQENLATEEMLKYYEESRNSTKEEQFCHIEYWSSERGFGRVTKEAFARMRKHLIATHPDAGRAGRRSGPGNRRSDETELPQRIK